MLLVLLAVTRVLFIPRYLILAVPCLYLTLGVGLLTWQRARALAMLAGIAGIAFHVANTNGAFFPSLSAPGASFVRNVPDADSRSNAFLERSCEYRPELASALRACAVLEAEARDRPIFAGNPYTRYLTLPRLGYVTKPLQVYNANYFDDAIRQYVCLAQQGGEAPVFVWAGMARANLPPPADTDHVLYRDAFDDPLIVYAKPFPPTSRREDIETWYLQATRTGAWPITRLELRLPYLCQTGRLDEAEAEYRTAIDAMPAAAADVRVRWFPEQAREIRRMAALLPACDAVPEEGLTHALANFVTHKLPIPKPPSALPQVGEAPPRLEGCLTPLQMAAKELRAGKIADATSQLANVPESTDPVGRAAANARYFLNLSTGDLTVPEEWGASGLEELILLTALARLQSGEYQQAIDALSNLSENLSGATILRAMAYARLEKWEISADLFARALEQFPGDDELRRRRDLALQNAATDGRGTEGQRVISH
jgi:tetratricopeptide (TPR) repeat protein